MNENKTDLIVFSDFDGSFAEKDIGHRIFTHFTGGKNLALVDQWKAMEISSRQCIGGEAAMIESITHQRLYEFLQQFKLRRGAKEFYQKLKDLNIPFYIVSDGSTLYIDYLLKVNDLSEIKYFSNRSKIEDDKFIVEFHHDNYGCKRCGCCKGARIKDVSNGNQDKKKVIFIGDGLSDICAIPYADLIFARGDLLEYCKKENIKAVEYQDFFDILEYLEKSKWILGQ